MIEFIAVVVFLALIWFFLKSRKKEAPNTILKNPSQSVTPIKPETATAPKASEPAQSASHTVESKHKPLVAQAVAVSLENNLLPQDSMLKRHYLTNLRAIVTSLSPQPPTDSVLLRHYNTQIAAKIEQCLNNEQAVAQLISQYEHSKTTTAPTVEVPEAIIEPLLNTETASENEVLVPQAEISKIPNDSMLRRHYLTQLYTQVAANLPQRPTDSTLRRHYNTMLENEVKNQLTQ